MQEIFCYLLNYYLSKFYFAFIFFFISIIFILLAYFFKRIKVINFILFGIFLALFIFEFTLASINIPLFDTMLFFEHYFINKQNSKVIALRHIKKASGQEQLFPTKDINQLLLNNSDVLFDVIYTIYRNDPFVFRYTKGNKDSNTSIVFLGCSFVFGHGVNDNQTLPYYFSKKYDFKYNVLNFGIRGTGTNFALNIVNSPNLINKFISKQSRVKYFIYTIIYSHVDRNFRTQNNYNCCLLADGKLSRVQEPFGIFKVIFKKSYVFDKTFLNLINTKNRSFHEQYLINSVLQMKNIIKEKYDAELIIILWPDIKWPDIKQKMVESLKDIDIIALDKKFENEEYSIKNDGHPNWKANEEIAQILFDYINNKP